ncbi:MAG: division/cell wall cluster transcriptional repressor MraZ [Nitrospina sp.]|jgi:MraZ protein|nr:division/cell wall cluster transcriptional repressor MraZ [Nitrospina sp.]
MNGFLGSYSVSLDEKGRLNVPSRFKGLLEQDSPQLVICVMSGFLVVFPQREWAVNEEKLSHLNAFDKSDRNRLREFYARATECEMKSGKILIPAPQREAAGLTKEVMIVGMSKTFELWAPDRLEKGSD